MKKKRKKKNMKVDLSLLKIANSFTNPKIKKQKKKKVFYSVVE